MHLVTAAEDLVKATEDRLAADTAARRINGRAV